MREKLGILDAGAQYGKPIDRRIRELCVESELLPMDTPADELRGYKAIVISGGPESVYDENAPNFDPEIFRLGIPLLGICYGMHLMNYGARGKIERKPIREDGQETISVDISSKLFDGLDPNQVVLLTHGDSIGAVGDGFKQIADSNGLVAAIEDVDRKLYGVQFHPEVDLTENGMKIFHNFLYRISGFSGSYTLEDREEKAIRYIREIVGNKKVLLLVSGGVDSTVCSALVNKAIGAENVYAIHIDNGFMRLDESAKVKKALEDIGLELRVISACEAFYNAKTIFDGREIGPLNKITSPEEKRNIIGDQFIRIAEKAIAELGLNWVDLYLAMGTLRPDLIESASIIASSKANVIKTHHNDTNLVRKLRDEGRVIEPLRDYHKDEVRKLGESLGLPEELVWRQPFPGPGLGIRVICAKEPYVTDDFSEINERLKQYETSDISATLLPIRTVGVQGDHRTLSYLVGLSGEKDWKELFRIAKEIPKRIHKVNRVAYIFGDKIEGEVRSITSTQLTPEVISQLQCADDIVSNLLLEYDLIRSLSQVPVISFPVNFGIPGNRSIGIRTFITNDFMTGVPAVPGKDIPEVALETMVMKILSEVPRISRVAYDLTSKPPGTTEWE